MTKPKIVIEGLPDNCNATVTLEVVGPCSYKYGTPLGEKKARFIFKDGKSDGVMVLSPDTSVNMDGAACTLNLQRRQSGDENNKSVD